MKFFKKKKKVITRPVEINISSRHDFKITSDVWAIEMNEGGKYEPQRVTEKLKLGGGFYLAFMNGRVVAKVEAYDKNDFVEGRVPHKWFEDNPSGYRFTHFNEKAHDTFYGFLELYKGECDFYPSESSAKEACDRINKKKIEGYKKTLACLSDNG